MGEGENLLLLRERERGRQRRKFASEKYNAGQYFSPDRHSAAKFLLLFLFLPLPLSLSLRKYLYGIISPTSLSPKTSGYKRQRKGVLKMHAVLLALRWLQ